MADHVVYVDHRSGEMERLLRGEQTMIIRGAAGRKLPHGRVFAGDRLYFIRNNGEGAVCAEGIVKSVHNSPKLTPEESRELVEKNLDKLKLSPTQMQKWAGKRYLVLIEVNRIKPVEPIAIDRSAFGNMDDWLPVGELDKVIV